MTARDVFYAIVELVGLAAISAAVGVGFVPWAGFLTAGVVFLLVSWVEARR